MNEQEIVLSYLFTAAISFCLGFCLCVWIGNKAPLVTDEYDENGELQQYEPRDRMNDEQQQNNS